LKELTLELKGEVSSARCESCDAGMAMLRVPETAQQIELAGDVPPAETCGSGLRGRVGRIPCATLGLGMAPGRMRTGICRLLLRQPRPCRYSVLRTQASH